ncbi:ATP-dependent RNA helicase NAM7 [Sugiyamaella lignohabitans]|uniref:ATP-dependent RNA helicase NAM7 n=1 Tax=Sugiyamaella lignohabitans TaxID=796027 RepID=A0A167FK74_9ASCO|nr:ATP-dependent RNA helicase NAM7 [Sugiyamaella lignohabitans]ANB15405.1 ATP-dependent RNA helicase NAM7 [Sugiyamaella lignohabitans]
MNLLAILGFSRLEGTTLETTKLLSDFINFQFDDFNGDSLTENEAWQRHSKSIKSLQTIAFNDFPELRVLALSNFGSIHNRIDLEEHLLPLSLEKLRQLASKVGIRYSYPEERKINDVFNTSQGIFIECFVEKYRIKRTSKEIGHMLEVSLDETGLASTFLEQCDACSAPNGEYPTTYSLSLQYLSIDDFLIRSFNLWKLEYMYHIRTHIDSVAKRIRPRLASSGLKRKKGKEQDNAINYGNGISEDGTEKSRELYLEGSSKFAAKVIGKPVVLDVAPPLVGDDIPSYVRVEVVLDLERTSTEVRKGWESLQEGEILFLTRFEGPVVKSTDGLSRIGLKYLRCGEFVRMLDENNRDIGKGGQSNGRRRKLHINYDARRYDIDETSLFEGFNLVVRNRPVDANFVPVLSSLKKLLEVPFTLPSWLTDIFLGFGHPAAASCISPIANWINFGYTLEDAAHMSEVFPGSIEVEKLTPGAQYKIRQKSADGVIELSNNNDINLWKKPSNAVKFTNKQVEAIFKSIHRGLSVVVTPPGTGKLEVAAQVISILYNNSEGRTLLMARSDAALSHLFKRLAQAGLPEQHLLMLGDHYHSSDSGAVSKFGRLETILQSRRSLLKQVDRLSELMGIPGAYGDSCESSLQFFNLYVEPTWKLYVQDKQAIPFPFEGFSTESSSDMVYLEIRHLFEQLESLRPYELLQTNKERLKYLISRESRVVAMTAAYATRNREELVETGFNYRNVIIMECGQLTELETFIPLTLQKDGNNIHRLVLFGDHHREVPKIKNTILANQAHLNQTALNRFVRLGVPVITLDGQGRSRPEIANLYNWVYKGLTNLPNTEQYEKTNAGLYFTWQFIEVGDYNGQGETETSPGFYQNLGEAENAVALYQYMRLLGYPREKISIISLYEGQKMLIEEIVKKRCTGSLVDNKIFGSPNTVSTIDQYQGEDNDYIILSLVRTKSPGFVSDPRVLTEALSRARLGLYVLGRREVIASSPQVEEFAKRLFPESSGENTNDSTSNDLLVVPGELYHKPLQVRNPVAMQGLAHLGQYVHEMTLKRYEYEQQKHP